MLESILPMFSKSFIVSGLMFRCLIHFEFIFVYGVRKHSSFILLQVVDQFFPGPLVKEIVFSPLYFFFCLLCQRWSVHRCVDLSLGFLFCSFDLYSCLYASTILSWWLWLCSRDWSQASWFLQFQAIFLKTALAIWGFLYFHTNCEIICSSSVKNTVGSLIGIALNL